MKKTLNNEFFSRNASLVAKEILGKIIARKIGKKILKAKIVETEAYFDENDPASRAVQKGDIRETMLMDPGTILVYGVHNNWLLNIVTNKKGKAEAILIRALEPLNFKEKTNGPGLLTKALNIDKKFHKKNILSSKEIWLEKNEIDGNFEIVESFRIGVKKDLNLKLRYFIKNNKFVSKK
ncbi:MAG: putative 3-methyladenine DNA glycosylase [Candidatus Pacearchaeota archaeon]|nr:MAG: putative 3-methyladenine DNA glycosylase [Candidatus Pacearchaeota archaeon]